MSASEKRAKLLLRKAAYSMADMLMSGSVREGMEFIHEIDPRTDTDITTIYPPRSDFRIVFKIEVANGTLEKHPREDVERHIGQELARLTEYWTRATKDREEAGCEAIG